MKPQQMQFDFNGLTFKDKESELTKQEKRVYSLIPKGKVNAVSADYIARTLNISIRQVVELVRHLRLKHFDIGSNQNGGYYECKDLEEHNEFIERFSRKQARSNHVLEALQQTRLAQMLLVEPSKKERVKE